MNPDEVTSGGIDKQRAAEATNAAVEQVDEHADAVLVKALIRAGAL